MSGTSANGGTSVPFSGRLRVVLSLGTAAPVAILLALAVPVQAADKTLVDKGEVLVRENCSRCHAIGKTGESPHPPAPPFRTLSRKYPVEDLAESLAEGIVSGHPDMPIFMFSPTDVEAIIQYLQSIQEQ
jgi:cytochrome c